MAQVNNINDVCAENLVAGVRYNIQPVGVPAARTHYAKDPYLLMAFNSRAAILSDENSTYTCILLHEHRFKIVNR
jgi:hypothetical protein